MEGDWSSMEISVKLRNEDYRVLSAIADKEYRTVEQQVAYILSHYFRSYESLKGDPLMAPYGMR